LAGTIIKTIVIGRKPSAGGTRITLALKAAERGGRTRSGSIGTLTKDVSIPIGEI
jgi:hypothetical protein